VFAADDGDDPEAARLADEAMEGSSPDGYGVCRAIAASLLPRLRLGQAEEAEHLHSGGYERVGQDPACWAAVADQLAFCAVAGEPQRAGDLAARHIGWLLSDPLSAASHRGRLRLATGVLMALATAHHAGLGDQPIEATKDPRLAGYLRLNGAGKVWTASDVLPSLLGAASRWAARFDARNGNYHVSDWLARMLALAGAGWEPSAGPDPFEAAGAVDPASPGAAGDSASAAEVYRINMAEVQRAIAAACADGDRGLVADLLVNKACAMAKSGLPASAATDFFRAADAYRSAAMPLDSLRAGLWAAQVIAERLDRPADAAVILADLSHQIAALPVGQEMNEIAQEIAQEIARIGHHIGLEAALGDPLAALSG
jgi:hypothetical protein